jgi:Spy/CpxP family protein refolding chaperone
MHATLQFVLAGVFMMATAVAVQAQTNGGDKVKAKRAADIPPGGIRPTPWFDDPALRTELKLTPEQWKQLDIAYREFYTHFKTAISQLGELTPAQRAERISQLAAVFNTDLTAFVKEKLAPAQAQRFHQLYYQYRGYDALNDPLLLPKLDLKEAQRVRLRKLIQDYDRQLLAVYAVLDTDAEMATRKYMELRRDINKRIDELLDQEQRRAWREITGSPYEFRSDFSRQIKTPLTTDSP